MVERKSKSGKKRDEERRGQLASERAAFELGPEREALADALGSPPPGYDLTIIRGFVRDQRSIVAVWDVNDPPAIRIAESRGWNALSIRVVDEAGESLERIAVGHRSGTFRIAAPASGITVSLELGFDEDDRFSVIARSPTLRIPPAENRSGSAAQFGSMPDGIDPRTLLRTERPPAAGHLAAHGTSTPAERLAGRLGLASLEFGSSPDDRSERDSSEESPSPPSTPSMPSTPSTPIAAPTRHDAEIAPMPRPASAARATPSRGAVRPTEREAPMPEMKRRARTLRVSPDVPTSPTHAFSEREPLSDETQRRSGRSASHRGESDRSDR